MELLNWGQRLLTTMTEVLDGERGVLSREPTAKAGFDVRSDIEALLPSFKTSKLKNGELALAAFRKLAPYFSAGFFLENGGTRDWLVTDVFLLGRHFKPGTVGGSSKQPLPFDLPPLRVGQVVRGRGAAVVAGFDLKSVPQLKESMAYVLRLSNGSGIMLLDDRPELWREPMIEKTYGILMRLMDER
jgi:hypothetical protein